MAAVIGRDQLYLIRATEIAGLAFLADDRKNQPSLCAKISPEEIQNCTLSLMETVIFVIKRHTLRIYCPES